MSAWSIGRADADVTLGRGLAVIDGRIVDIARTGFVLGTLVGLAGIAIAYFVWVKNPGMSARVRASAVSSSSSA